jgi:DNA-binding HxlR family transcriptional regulator
MRDILIDGKRHYRELLASPEHIATNILSTRLRSLIEADLLKKVEGETNRSQTMYLPTQKALDLLPALLAIMQWGIQYNKNVDLSIPFMQEVKKDKDAVGDRLLKQLQTSY